jgi:cytochrome c oxidase subunit 2
MYGRTETLKDGTTVIVDDAYIRESILDPGAKVVAEFENIMLKYPLSDAEIEALVEFSRQISVP